MPHLSSAQLHAGLAGILAAPKEAGAIELIVRRPAVDRREVVATARLDLRVGLVGDSWTERPSSRTPDRTPHPDMQVTLMNARVIALLAGSREGWPLAGDQFFVDLDLSAANLPAGTRLALGGAVLEVTTQPHTGCGKFVERFGLDAMKWVNSPEGHRLNLRGINARVVHEGLVRTGTIVRKCGAGFPI